MVQTLDISCTQGVGLVTSKHDLAKKRFLFFKAPEVLLDEPAETCRRITRYIEETSRNADDNMLWMYTSRVEIR